MSTDMDKHDPSVTEKGALSRREFLKKAGIAGAAVGLGAGMGGLVVACGGTEETTTTAGATTTTAAANTTTTAAASTTISAAAETGRDLKIGVISPQTGSLAPFAIAVNWAIDRANEYLKDGIVTGDGKQRKLDIVKKDTQSDANRSATVTADLIQSDKVDIVLSSGGPDTINPSADACEAYGCPSISSASVWQSFYYDRKPPETGFKWTYGSLLGAELTIACFADMYDQIPNNKIVGMLFANDADAAGWMNEQGAPAVFNAKGYTMVEPSWYAPGTEDFGTQISEFKKKGCEIICGSNNPGEFTNFWKQCIQQGFHPKLVSTGKALLFPETLAAIGPVGYGLMGETGWHRTYPYKDSITGQTSEDLAQDYEAKMKVTPSTNTTGMYQLVEWMVDIFKRATNPEDKESVVEAISTTKMITTNGEIDFTAPVDITTKRPVLNVYKATVCGGQWVKGKNFPFEMVICSNAAAPDVTVGAKVEPMVYS
jgi:branched-chain amino acid transport system substrate-binding protein